MKNLLKTLIILFSIATSAQIEKQELIRESLKSKRDSLLLISVSEIIRSFNTKDSIIIDNYIDKQIGIFSFRSSNENFDFIRNLSFADEKLSRLPKQIKDSNVRFESSSKYNCKHRKWSSIGILIDTVNIHRPFSELITNQGRDPSLGIVIMENNSRRIIVSQKNDSSIIFYLGFYREKWWLTFFDLRENYCSEN